MHARAVLQLPVLIYLRPIALSNACMICLRLSARTVEDGVFRDVAGARDTEAALRNGHRLGAQNPHKGGGLVGQQALRLAALHVLHIHAACGPAQHMRRSGPRLHMSAATPRCGPIGLIGRAECVSLADAWQQ